MEKFKSLCTKEEMISSLLVHINKFGEKFMSILKNDNSIDHKEIQNLKISFDQLASKMNKYNLSFVEVQDAEVLDDQYYHSTKPLSHYEIEPEEYNVNELLFINDETLDNKRSYYINRIYYYPLSNSLYLRRTKRFSLKNGENVRPGEKHLIKDNFRTVDVWENLFDSEVIKKAYKEGLKSSDILYIKDNIIQKK